MILIGHVIDRLREQPANSVHCVVTSPPYWGLRCYGTEPQVWGDGWRGELGSEPTPEMYCAHMVEVFSEVKRVLRDDGTCWVNIGDSYQSGKGQSGGVDPKQPARRHGIRPNDKIIPGLKPKDLVGIPWLLAFALRANGWYLRDEIIWEKPNCMPSSVTDRTTRSHEQLFLLGKSRWPNTIGSYLPIRCHEHVFLLAKCRRYYYDADAIREPCTSKGGGASFGKQNHSADGTGSASRKLASPAERNHPLGRNKRSVWTIPTQSFHGAHFATFPMRLVEPCIKAGTSEQGCCPACGAPWLRVVDRTPMQVKHGPKSGGYGSRTTDGISGTMIAPAKSVTIGWRPGCKCDAGEPIPCTVLDPFLGSGTTAVVAESLGRSWIGCELNAEYAAMACERIGRQGRLFV